MDNVVRLSKHLIPIEQIALFEPFVPSDPPLRTSREFKGRVVLLDRVSILSERTPEQLAEENSFRFLAADRIATNPAIHFRVETFLPGDTFRPSKPYLSRLIWNDADGNTQSKLLLTSPEDVLTIVLRGDPSEPGPSTAGSNIASIAAGSRRRKTRRRSSSPSPA